MIDITKMFTKRALFSPEYAALEQVQMSRYSIMLKMEIREFMSTQWYSSVFELQLFAWRREIEFETQIIKRSQTLV